MIKLVREDHRREVLEDLMDLTASVAGRAEARIEAKSKEVVPAMQL
jgi:hypothetical protein